ncbi:MAG: redoxin domain-containing protein [Bacteroidales bacterium]|jgi:peroxiredoxin|nr:redoxin domain-containing protein [Bacteroidales bacterium]
MKRFAIMIIACFASIAGFAQGYVIDAQVKDVDGGLATLRLYFKDGNERVDSTTIDNKGRFVFRGDVKDPIPAVLTINGKRTYRLYIENAQYKLKIDPSSFAKSKFEGSQLTTKWYELTTPRDKEDYGVHLKRLENWILNNPDDIFCSDLIATYLSFQWGYKELNRTLNTLQRNAQQTYFYIHLRERSEALKTIEIGAKAPDFAMANTKGQNITLYSCLKGTQYLLIDFWASWCKPCRDENPNVLAAYNKYKASGFDILGVSLDKDKNAWEKAIKDDSLVWRQVSDLKFWKNEAAQLYMINSIPSNVLLDSKGTIIARNLRGEELINKLAELTSEHGYLIEGEIEGIREGVVKMDLLLADGEKQSYSADVNHGKFVFKGIVERVCMALIHLPSNDGDISFFLENSNIKITGDKKHIDDIKITGSQSNDEFAALASRCNVQKNPIQCLMNEVLENSNTIYAPLIVSNYLVPYLNINELTELVGKLDGDAKTMYQYVLLTDYIDEQKQTNDLGEKVPDFTLADTGGTDVKLSDFIRNKRYILIDFWASDIPACAVDAQTLQTAYRAFGKRGFDIISISLDTDKSKWQQGISNQSRKWQNVSDLQRWQSAVVRLYKVASLPANVLIDANGAVIGKDLKGDALLQTLQQLLDE